MPAPAKAEQHVSSYQIKIAGQLIDKAYSDAVREVRVVSSLGAPDVCTFKIGLSTPAKAGQAHPIDGMPFVIAKTVEIRLGEREGRAPSTLFKGEVVSVEPTFGAGGCQVNVRALDPSHKLYRGRKTRAFQNQTVSDIVGKVCREAGLSASTEASGGPLEYMLQANETDWEFIHRIAEAAGMVFVMVDGRAKFGHKWDMKPKAPGPEIVLNYPKEIFQYAPRVSSTQQVESVELLAWDRKAKAVVTGRAQTPGNVTELGIKRSDMQSAFKGAKVQIATEPVADSDHAKKAAQSLLDRMSDNHAAADGMLPGNPAVKAGAVVQVKGVGDKFGGKMRVHTATHVLRGGGTYETHFTSASNTTIAAALGRTAAHGGGGSPFASGLVIGIVSNNEDPEALGRVKVKFPTLGDSESGWAPVASVSAGKERGVMMLPIVGDEVAVLFEHEDISRPVVIGSLFNGKAKPGEELPAGDGSYTLRSDKKLISRAKEEIELEGGKTYTVKMKGDVEETFEAKLTTTVTGNITIEAKQGNITIKSGGNIELSSTTGNVTIKGMMVKVEAQSQLDLSSTGMTNVKGSMVNLG